MGSLTKTTRAILALFSSPGTTLRQIQPNPALGTAKITKMPPPAVDHVDKDVQEVTLPLFSSQDPVTSKGIPALEEVQQANAISNCPVAAILAAHAFTAVGRNFIADLVSTTSGTVVTDLSAVPKNPPNDSGLVNPPPGNTISSSRYFTVKLFGGSIDVSDVLYIKTDDGSIVYGHDPSDPPKSIWVAIIEKALAAQIQSYENFDALPLTANDWWKKITGVNPDGFPIEADTPLTKIIDAAKASTLVPTIGASKDVLPLNGPVKEFHGYAMIGMQGSKIRLYEPADAKKRLFSPAVFRQNFKAILHSP